MSSFDEYAKAAARRGVGPSRRDVLKRAGTVGAGVVASSALIQSVSAPAFAAVSGPCTPAVQGGTCGGSCAPCANGLTCYTNGDCASNACGYDNVCRLASGSLCTGTTQLARDASCASGVCSGNTNTSTCVTPAPIAINATCHGATIAVANSTCVSPAVCSSGKDNMGATSGQCNWANGHSCAHPHDCASNSCVSGVCS